jgi:type IV pilus assembly protein PilM
LNTVLAEYESLFRGLGYSPGVVIPSTLAALGNVEVGDPVMVIKSDAATTSLAIVGNDRLLLFRTVENSFGGGAPTGDQLAEDVHPSLIYFQDTYNMRVEHILVCGQIEAEQVGPSLEAQTGARVQDLVAARHLGADRRNLPASALAGVAGALLG